MLPAPVPLALIWSSPLAAGQSLTMAKALAALVPAPHSAMRYLEVVGAGQPLDVAPLPLVAISDDRKGQGPKLPATR